MKVLVGIPSYQPGGVGTTALLRTLNRKNTFAYKEETGSLLTWNHNRLLATALNLRQRDDFTHLMLMHSDVSPEDDDWFETFCAEAEASQADVIAATIPIKDNVGATSTALDIGKDKWHPARLSQKQVCDLPKTFTADKLLLNTGLMLINLSCPWLGRVCFHMQDIVEKDAEGNWVARVASEDWEFSREAVASGAKLYATSAVRLFHHGTAMWSNRAVWGGDWPADLNQEVIFSSPDGEMKVLKF